MNADNINNAAINNAAINNAAADACTLDVAGCGRKAAAICYKHRPRLFRKFYGGWSEMMATAEYYASLVNVGNEYNTHQQMFYIIENVKAMLYKDIDVEYKLGLRKWENKSGTNSTAGVKTVSINKHDDDEDARAFDVADERSTASMFEAGDVATLMATMRRLAEQAGMTDVLNVWLETAGSCTQAAELYPEKTRQAWQQLFKKMIERCGSCMRSLHREYAAD